MVDGTTGPNNGMERRSRKSFGAWEAFDRLFDEAFSRIKSAPLTPDIATPSYPLHFPEQSYSYDAHAAAGETPYALRSPLFDSSDESLVLSTQDDQEYREGEDPFDRIWNEGLSKTRRSTVTSAAASKMPRRNTRRTFESSGGSTTNSTSVSNETSRSRSSGGLLVPQASAHGPLPPPPPPPPAALHEPAKASKLQRRKSRVTFKDSADGRNVTATFEMSGVKKSDIHVSYQTDKVVITWESVKTEERMEGEQLVRDRREKKYVRTLPLPEGTKFEQVKASMDGRHLMLTYPKFTARKPVQIIEIKTGD